MTERGPEELYATCAEPECTEEIIIEKWLNIGNREWFFQKDGTVWCPNHIPEWVTEWRARRQSVSK